MAAASSHQRHRPDGRTPKPGPIGGSAGLRFLLSPSCSAAAVSGGGPLIPSGRAGPPRNGLREAAGLLKRCQVRCFFQLTITLSECEPPKQATVCGFRNKQNICWEFLHPAEF